ncbi:MAG TPA: branched-chain amino acid ABC transporter substrate-binding protein [Candidatus Limnocylindria bacterium]|nr:branched-chain amino acid ABC transporter substrate-binding protein [Candidatus Limnocylindria bacterium]
MKLRSLMGVGMAGLLVVAACQAGPGTTPAAPGTPAPGAPQQADQPPTDDLGVVAIPAGEPLHIGFWGVLSGADAALGEDARRGTVIALNDIDNQWLGREVRLTTQDALCTPEGGATAATALVADTTIVGLVGSSCSAETAGGIGTITDAGFTTISPSNTRPAFTDPDERGPELDGYLRTAHSDAIQGVVAAEYIYNELNITEAATIHMSEAYSEALVRVFEESFTGLGGTITGSGATARGETDMRPMLTDLAGGDPGAIYYPLFTAEFGFVTAQVRDIQGLEDVVLMGADAGFSAEAMAAAGPNSEGALLSSPDFEAFGAGYGDFLAKYQEQFGSAPIQIFHAHAYDATNILLNAIAQVAVQTPDGTLHVPRGALREAMFATSNHEGVIGTINCNELGDCSAPVIAIYEITPEIAADPQPNWPPDPIFSTGD